MNEGVRKKSKKKTIWACDCFIHVIFNLFLSNFGDTIVLFQKYSAFNLEK